MTREEVWALMRQDDGDFNLETAVDRFKLSIRD